MAKKMVIERSGYSAPSSTATPKPASVPYPVSAPAAAAK